MSNDPMAMVERKRQGNMSMAGDPRTTHPDDLLTHMRVEHLGTLNAISDGVPRDVLELAHAQRHAGLGCGADHAPDDHDTGGFS